MSSLLKILSLILCTTILPLKAQDDQGDPYLQSSKEENKNNNEIVSFLKEKIKKLNIESQFASMIQNNQQEKKFVARIGVEGVGFQVYQEIKALPYRLSIGTDGSKKMMVSVLGLKNINFKGYGKYELDVYTIDLDDHVTYDNLKINRAYLA